MEIKEKEMISSETEKIGKEKWLGVAVHAQLDPKHLNYSHLKNAKIDGFCW